MSIIDVLNEKMAAGKKVIGKGEIAEAVKTLKEYKNAKNNLEQRIINDEEFFKLRYRKRVSNEEADKNWQKSKPTTAWLLNSVVSKHADLMDNYPVASCLPREQQDESDAKILSSIVPVILEYNDYEDIYSDAAWYYIKHGISVQGVFWDNRKENGLGDISIKNTDVLNLFWEPGITNLQDSRNLFYVSLVDNEVLDESYTDIDKGKLRGDVINVSDYIYDDTIDNSEKSLVVDWYYKKTLPTGQEVLHYCKFVGDTVLFASENEAGYESGFYEHGKYPFVMSRMYPEAGTPYGFGIISVCRDPQQYIDIFDGLMLDYMYKLANPRFWAKKSAGVNKKDFIDWKIPIVEVEGDIDEEKLRQINLTPMNGQFETIRQAKIDELKETSFNRDFSQGGTASGITSGAAIATLQEAGNKTSRDMIKSLYRGYTEVCRLLIELIRQFYDERRMFRITGENGEYEFYEYSNENIKEQQMMTATGESYFRKPIFDIDVKAEKSNPYSRMSQNETAANLYNMGIFVPENAQPALGMLEIMDFEGKEKVREYVSNGMTLQKMVEQQQQQIVQLNAIIERLTGETLNEPNAESGMGDTRPQGSGREYKSTDPVAVANDNAKGRALNSYGEELVKRARASV